MADWLSSMQQTFEYYIVDPYTWTDMKRIDNVKTSTISRDTDASTLGSATIDITESVGECYLRIYLIIIQKAQDVFIFFCTVNNRKQIQYLLLVLKFSVIAIRVFYN